MLVSLLAYDHLEYAKRAHLIEAAREEVPYVVHRAAFDLLHLNCLFSGR